MTAIPRLTRDQVLARRRSVAALDRRLPPGAASLRRAGWAGLQDSMPRGALLSIHARVQATAPTAWEDPALVQVWGPRYSAYVVAAEDRAVFTLGRLPDAASGRRAASRLADDLEAFLDGRRMPYGEAGTGLGVAPNALRYAAPTGRVLLRWDGARQPVIWTVPAPEADPREARLELARRHLHVFGPTTPVAFGTWAGIPAAAARAAFDALAASLVAVRTPAGEGWLLSDDETHARDAQPADDPAPARLLPSGDTLTLLQGPDRALLVPEPEARAALWPSRVWPGALLLAGELAGTWRRAGADVTVRPWRSLGPAERAAVEAEAASLPLPALASPIRVHWER